MQVNPIQSESLGTRSLATLVETPDIKILLDPGSALGIRFGLLPHPIEYEIVRKTTEKLCYELGSKIDAIFISHYHKDHYITSFPNYTFHYHSLELAEALYTDKIIYAKHPRVDVNYSQKKRGGFFEKLVSSLAKQLIWCDGLEFAVNDTLIHFSPAVWHGTKNTPLGFIVQSCITHHNKRFVFGSDYQCLNRSAIRWTLAQRPDLLLVGGPPIYLKGWKIGEDVLDLAKKNLIELTKQIPRVLVDHHLLRSVEWKDWLKEISIAAEQERGHICECIADYKGLSPKLLEVQRIQLYEQDPPDQKFLKWTKLTKKIRAKKPPPI
ncbi:MAG: MBL fold metallo-hydrolase [Candidatus Hodarchaeota archaeon]